LRQSARRAASRAAWIAGKSSATKIPMIAITTNSSTRVNPICGDLAIRSRLAEFALALRIDESSLNQIQVSSRSEVIDHPEVSYRID
jgi:hypothetical protein